MANQRHDFRNLKILDFYWNLRIESFLITFAETNFCEIDQNPGNLT